MRTSGRFTGWALAAVLLAGGAARAETAPGGAPTKDGLHARSEDAAPRPFSPAGVEAGDKATLQKLHDANQMEIQMGRLAQDHGSTKAVREFGKRLMTDHTAADAKLEAFLRTRGSDLASFATTTSADADHELLATKSGTDFDRAFGQQMVRDHQKAIDLINSARVETADDTLRMLYDQLIPVIQNHKRVAEQIVAASVRS
jgi:putative membrane protein